LAGADRVATASAISRDLYPEGGEPAAVLARADAFPDALAGAPAARAVDGPLLLTRSDGLTAAVRSELDRVLAEDATVYLLGGESALGAAVVDEVEALGAGVERLAGADRFATSVAAAELTVETGTAETGTAETGTAMVASGDDFPDALAAAAIAGNRGWPILLTSGDAVPDDVVAHVDEAGYDAVHVVGGSGVVGDEVVAELERHAGEVTRVAGDNRFETAEALSQRFAPEAEQLGVASGTGFPDALAGGVHAASRGAPLALVAGSRPFEAQRRQVRTLEPDALLVYGGDAAVTEGVVDGLRGASIETGALRVERASLRDGATVHELDDIDFAFNQRINLAESHVSVTIDGDEVGGTTSHIGSADTLRFAVDDLPDGVRHDETYRVRVQLLATSGADVVTDHLEVDFRRPPRDLSRGATGDGVADLQRRLRERGFWLPEIDGRFGSRTHHAVVAFQKAHELERDGVVGPDVRAVLREGAGAPAPRYGSARAYEIDLERGIVLFVDGGETRWVFDASAGHGEWYTFEGSTYRANTTTGSRAMVRQIDGIREAARGELYRPKYFDSSRGIALHGYTSVPPYHASSGCVRITLAAMDKVWDMDPGLGTDVHVYPVDYYES
jgi:putative cell wall-binding protein